MLAELHNKISQLGTNLSDRLEDQLTGDFFGTLRYLPFQLGIGPILAKSKFQTTSINQSFQKIISYVKDYDTCKLYFWKWTGNGEIDLLLEMEDAVIGVEVKYLSGISSDDGADFSIDNSIERSNHQLFKYAEWLHLYSTHKLKFLLFLAPTSMEVAVMKDIRDREFLNSFDSVSFGGLSWQDNLQTLHELYHDSLEPWQKLIISDLEALLVKKDLRSSKGYPTVWRK